MPTIIIDVFCAKAGNLSTIAAFLRIKWGLGVDPPPFPGGGACFSRSILKMATFGGVIFEKTPYGRGSMNP